MNKIQFFLIFVLSVTLGQSFVHAGGSVEKQSYAFPTALSQYQVVEEEYASTKGIDSEALTLLER